MALNTLGIDPQRIWKGVWRFFHEDMLNCVDLNKVPITIVHTAIVPTTTIVPTPQVKKEGVSLDDFVSLANCNGVDIVLHRYGKQEREQKSESEAKQAFRHMVIESLSSPYPV
jgi:glutathione gamma-glutamylcysteinyltransferase